jgi:predicted dehydrogenase
MSETDLEPIRWGILSTALINTKVLRGAALTASAEIRAVASRTSTRATRFAREWGIPVSYGTYDALLADPTIEAVYIPLPNGLHHEWTMRALHAGKHVLCEKPYSRHPTEVIDAFDLAKANGLVMSEAYMYRYNPQTLHLADLVASGEIGELRLINSSFTWPTDAPGDVRLDPTLAGGSLLDVGCYCVNAARLLAGEPTTANAQWKIGPTGSRSRWSARCASKAMSCCISTAASTFPTAAPSKSSGPPGPSGSTTHGTVWNLASTSFHRSGHRDAKLLRWKIHTSLSSRSSPQQ